MILSFKEMLLKRPTYFKAKILMSIPPIHWKYEHKREIDTASDAIAKTIRGKHSNNPGIVVPKIHSIRSGKRWYPGLKIHFASGVRTKNYNCWLEWRCCGVQNIEIRTYHGNDDILLFIDGVLQNGNIVDLLYRNDGFEDYPSFLHFVKSQSDKGQNGHYIFNGQIVHWTPFKY